MEAADKAELEAALSREKEALENQLGELSGEQNRSQAELAALAGQLAKEAAGKAELKEASAEEIGRLEKKYAALQGDYDKKQGELTALAGDIEAGKDKIAGLEEGYTKQLGELEDKYQGLQDRYEGNLDEVAKLGSALGAARRSQKKSAEDMGKVQGQLAEKDRELAGKDRELEEALELAKRRQDLAKNIQDNFRQHGIVAEVDAKTGDVILDFGDDYFESDSYQLKSGMEHTIRKAIPVYAESLFADESLTSKISSVEIIGFASATYAGKPVDPRNLSRKNRKAVNYNLDLSYKRARSIFRYAFDIDNFRFDYQDKMLPLLNVTGRSFFSEDIDPSITGNLTIDEFCGQYNCNKSQRVIIKFGLLAQGESR